jgi:hypothetical protein
MGNGIGPGRQLAQTSMHRTREGDVRMTTEIAYRMTRLRAEAERERLVTAPARRVSARARLGHAVMFLGCLIEGAGSQEGDCGRLLRA